MCDDHPALTCWPWPGAPWPPLMKKRIQTLWGEKRPNPGGLEKSTCEKYPTPFILCFSLWPLLLPLNLLLLSIWNIRKFSENITALLPLRASLMAQLVKNLPATQETWVQSLGRKDPLEKEMATHSSILAWRIPWTEERSRLQSMGLQRVRHSWVANTCILI